MVTKYISGHWELGKGYLPSIIALQDWKKQKVFHMTLLEDRHINRENSLVFAHHVTLVIF